MTYERQPWWDFDPNERPIPLDPVVEAVADEAAAIVESQRRAIMREDTDPNGETIAALRMAVPAPRTRVIGGIVSLRRVAVALLSLGCVAMFLLGWVEGATEAKALVPAPARVMPDTNVETRAESNEGLGSKRHLGRVRKEVSKP